MIVVNDYAFVGGWVDYITENVVPNACRVDGYVFYTRLNSGSGEIKCDDSVGFLDVIYSIVCERRVFCDVLRTWEWYFRFGFGGGIR